MDKTDLGSRMIFTFIEKTDDFYKYHGQRSSHLIQNLQKHENIENGILLDAMEKRVSYPFIHMRKVSPTEFCSWNSSRIQLTQGEVVGKCHSLPQGLYEEVRRIEPNIRFSARDRLEDRAFIFLGFKSLETGFSSILESTWRDWTGARAIYLKLHDQFDLSKIVFYHRVEPAVNIDLFMYIVVIECWHVNQSNMIHALDFIQRMRVERMTGYISIYRGTELNEDSNLRRRNKMFYRNVQI